MKLAALFELLKLQGNSEVLSPPRITPDSVDLKLTAGVGVVNRKVKYTADNVPFVDDGDTAAFGEIGAGVQIPLSHSNGSHTTSLFLGVNHRVVGGVDLHALDGTPFRMKSSSTTSFRAELIVYLTPRIVDVN